MKQLRSVGLSMGVALLATLSLACGGGNSDKAPAPKATSKIVYGYFAGRSPVVLQSVKSNSSCLSDVAEGGMSLDADCNLIGSLFNSELLPFNKTNNIRSYTYVDNALGGDFNADLGHSALVTHKDKVIDSFVALTKDGGFQGFNLDFEGLYPADRAAYSQFVHELAVKLHASGLKLALSVPAVSEDDPTDDWAGAFDYAAIGIDADLLQLMTYDENGPTWSDPGPIAGADWVEECAAYAATVVSPSKLLLGLPAYGYDWDLTAYAQDGAYPFSYVPWTTFCEWLANPTAVNHWDATTLSPSVTYESKDGHKHEAWFENPESIQAKAALVKKYNLAGLSVWSLGQEDARYWKAAIAGLQ